MVTSSAVVGSSAIRMSGSLASAIAIMTRWRWPPESSWGKAPSRAAASRMPTSSRSSSTRRRAASGGSPLCKVSTSATWRSTLCSGFNAVIGSWKIMAMRLPRMRLITAPVAPRSSSPLKRMLPEGWRALG